MKELVVVGNGMVGHRLVQAMRDRDTAGAWRITVLGEETRPAYDRVALSSYVDGVSAEELTLPEVADPLVQLHLGDAAVALDRDARMVRTAAGRELPYDALVLATGSVPFVPPVPGRDLPGCFVYRTLDDLDAITAAAAARRSRARLPGRRSAVVVGGGLLGLEAARALRLLGLSPAGRRDRAAADAGAGRRGRRRAAAPARGVRGPRGALRGLRHRHQRGPRSAGRRRSPTASSWTPTSSSSPPASAPPTALARAAGLPVGERGGVLVDDRVPHAGRARLGDRRGAPRWRAAPTGWSRRGTRWPRWWPTGCSAARPR